MHSMHIMHTAGWYYFSMHIMHNIMHIMHSTYSLVCILL